MTKCQLFKELERSKQINQSTYTHMHMTSSYKHPSLTWVPGGLTYSISRIIPKIIGRLSLRTWVPEYWGMYTSRSGTFSQYVQFRLTGHSPALLGSIHKRPSPLLSQGAALQNTRFGGNGIFCNTTTWLLETKPDSCKPRICLFLFWLGRWIADGLVLICLSSGVSLISVSQAPKRQTKTNPERRNDQAREGAMTEDGFTTADFAK